MKEKKFLQKDLLEPKKIGKYTTSISEDVYIDKLDYIVNKYSNA